MPKSINSRDTAREWWSQVIEEHEASVSKTLGVIKEKHPSLFKSLIEERTESAKVGKITSAKPWLFSTEEEGARWTSANREFGIPFQPYIPHWIEGASESERLYNWSQYIERENLTRRRKLPTPKMILKENWQSELSRAMGETDYFTSPGMLKWRKNQALGRSDWYSSISASSFSSDFLADRGYTNVHGKLYRIGDAESLPSGKESAALFEKAGFSLDEANVAGLRIESRSKSSPKILGPASRQDLIRDVMDWEIGNQNLITRVAPKDFAASSMNWVVGSSASNIHFMTPDQQAAYGREFLGQTKFIKTTGGRTIVAGQKAITGRYLEGDVGFQYIEARKRFKRMSEIRAFREARSIYFRAASAIPEERRAKIERMLVDVAGSNALDSDYRVLKREINIAKAKELKRSFWSTIGASRLEETNVKGMDVREWLSDKPVGTKVRLSGGIRGTVEWAEAPTEMAIKYRGKITSLADAIEKEKRRLEKLTFPVRLTREPGKFKSAFKEGMYYDSWATSIRTVSGEKVGWLSRKSAKWLHKDIKMGTLPDEDLFARILFNEQKQNYALTLLRKSGDEYISSGLEMSANELNKDLIDAVFTKRVKIQEAEGGWRAFFDSKFKTVFREKKAIPTISAVEAAEKSLNKKWLTGAAIAAGALLLYGATRQKRQSPLTEKDLPRSMYGDVGLTPAAQRVYTPQARITPNNTGYDTSFDIEANDPRGDIDHRALVNTMSAISNRALGVQRTHSSVHIMDESQRMDRESVRRKMNSQLG